MRYAKKFFWFRGVEIAVNFYSPSSNEILRPVMFSTDFERANFEEEEKKNFRPDSFRQSIPPRFFSSFFLITIRHIFIEEGGDKTEEIGQRFVE